LTPTQIRCLRKLLDMTGEDFGTALGYTGKHRRKSVWALETGRRKPSGPTLMLLKQLRRQEPSNLWRHRGQLEVSSAAKKAQ
jgi:DNA-binding transcriptional regulator YiaG